MDPYPLPIVWSPPQELLGDANDGLEAPTEKVPQKLVNTELTMKNDDCRRVRSSKLRVDGHKESFSFLLYFSLLLIFNLNRRPCPNGPTSSVCAKHPSTEMMYKQVFRMQLYKLAQMRSSPSTDRQFKPPQVRAKRS